MHFLADMHRHVIYNFNDPKAVVEKAFGNGKWKPTQTKLNRLSKIRSDIKSARKH